MMSTVVFAQKSGTGTFHRFAKSGVAVCIIACALAAPARAGTNVAVIEEGVGEGPFWCNFLIANGHPCTIFPPSGPTAALDSFQVVIDLSRTWADPSGSLADFLQAGKGVITRGAVPGKLGIETNPTVQAWVGATFLTLGEGVCLTIATDEILGSIPPGTNINDCGDAGCAGLGGESGFPNVKVLARWESGTSSVGLMRNTWETGQSVYLPYYFDPDTPESEYILLRTMDVLSRPIPTVSTWGNVVTTLLIAIAGCLIFLRKERRRMVAMRSTGGARPNNLTITIVSSFAAFGMHAAQAQEADEIRVEVGPQNTQLYLNHDAGGWPKFSLIEPGAKIGWFACCRQIIPPPFASRKMGHPAG